MGVTIAGTTINDNHASGYPYLYPGSLRVSLQIDKRNDASLTVATQAATFIPQVGQELLIYDSTPALIFGGVITSAPMVRPGSGVGAQVPILVTVQSNGYWNIPARRTVTTAYGEQTCGYIIGDLITTYLSEEGITAGDIDAGITLTDYVRSASNIAVILDELAELSGYKWVINNDRTLDFYAEDTVGAAAHELVEGGAYTRYSNVRVEESLESYRNKQFVVGGDVLQITGESVGTGDGAETHFTLDHAPIAPTELVVYIDAVEITAYTVDNQTGVITFAAAPGIGEVVTADYIQVGGTGTATLVYSKELTAEIAARHAVEGEGSSGVYGHVFRNTAILTETEAEATADNLLKLYGVIPQQIDFDSLDIDWRPGTQVTAALPTFGLGQTMAHAPIPAPPSYVEVWDATDLDNVRNDLDALYIQMADIDLTAFGEWTPIGAYSPSHPGTYPPFTGRYIGNGYTVSGLHITTYTTPHADTSSPGCGLFGCVSYPGVIEGVHIRDCHIDYTAPESNASCGAVVGFLWNGQVLECSGTGYVRGSGSGVGGLIGLVTAGLGSAFVKESWFEGTVLSLTTGGWQVGGLIGSFGYNNVNVDGGVEDCYARITLSQAEGVSWAVAGGGGVVGNISGSYVRRVYATGTVSGTSRCGGLVGSAHTGIYGTSELTASVALTTVIERLSGAEESFGRVTGYFPAERVRDDNYALDTMVYRTTGGDSTTFPSMAATVTGKDGGDLTAAESKLQATYEALGWNFTTIWAIDPNVNDGYPYLIDNPPESLDAWEALCVIERVDIVDVGAPTWQSRVSAVRRADTSASSQRRDGWKDWFGKLVRKIG